jgi:hypothetical protein
MQPLKYNKFPIHFEIGDIGDKAYRSFKEQCSHCKSSGNLVNTIEEFTFFIKIYFIHKYG